MQLAQDRGRNVTSGKEVDESKTCAVTVARASPGGLSAFIDLCRLAAAQLTTLPEEAEE